MQKIILVFAAMLSLYSSQGFAKEEATKTSFKVSGNCEQCKKRIEKAAKTDGVKSANWNVETNIATVTFEPAKISPDQIQQNIAKAGYDTEKFKAEEEAYKKLPKCCQYERKDYGKQ